MGISKYNCEGYFDPTPHFAISNIDKEIKKWRPIVYICSPYSGDITKNLSSTKRYCRFAVSKGAIPLAPHLLFTQFLNDDIYFERTMGLHFGNVLMSHCAEVWVFGETVTQGMDAEIKRAKRKNYILRYFTEKCEEITNI